MRYVEDINQVAGSQKNKMTQQHVVWTVLVETNINQRLNLWITKGANAVLPITTPYNHGALQHETNRKCFIDDSVEMVYYKKRIIKPFLNIQN